MHITRYNYEEFFLLLADGELAPAQEEMVLAFTQQHPDLEEELNLMMDCKLEAEVPPIFPKEKLLKPVIWNIDVPENIQMQLLDLLDNELDDVSKSTLEKRIANDAFLQLEWNLLQSHLKLPAAEAPPFPKEKLLKPTTWNVDEPETIYVQMMAMLDNELPATEKLQLEQKIAASKALQIEWKSLQQIKLVPDVVHFPKANLLQADSWNVEQPNAIYVQMMALLDNELPTAEKLQLEQKIARDIWLQNAWQSFQNTKLIAEIIEFPNKQLLYKEKEQRRIGGWMRWAAVAAVLLGFGWFLLPPKNVNLTNGMATNTVKETKRTVADSSKKELVKTPLSLAKISEQKVVKWGTDNVRTKEELSNEMAAADTEKISKKNNAEKQKNIFKKTVLTKNKLTVNSEPNTETANTMASNTNNEEVMAFNSTRKIISGNAGKEHETANRQPDQLNSIANNSNTYAFRTASYKAEELTEDADNDVVYIAGARLSKQKVRGVFRGITRSLGRSFTKSKVASENENPPLSRSLTP